MSKKKVLISITEKQYEKLEELCEETGLPKSGIVSLALENLPMFAKK